MSLSCICVFCGSSSGARPAYRVAAERMGQAIARAGLALVYGGGRIGLMGALADAALAAGSEVVGVIPESLFAKEVAHERLTRLHVVASMHERKALMADLADGFAAIPGGWGTFDELFEVLTWAQIGLHRKPVCLVNVKGYFDPLLAMADHAVTEGFVRLEHRRQLMVAGTPEEAIDRLRSWTPTAEPPVQKWLDLR